MSRAFVLIMAVAGIWAAGCGTDTATQDRTPESLSVEAAPVAPAPSAVAVPENPTDRNIRRDLSSAIAAEADLKLRQISFIVTNGDVNVTGTVRTEEERKKINDLAMNIDGVKSVANALRVGE